MSSNNGVVTRFRNLESPKPNPTAPQAAFEDAADECTFHADEPYIEKLTGWRRFTAVSGLWLACFVLLSFSVWLIYQAVIVADWLLRISP